MRSVTLMNLQSNGMTNNELGQTLKQASVAVSSLLFFIRCNDVIGHAPFSPSNPQVNTLSVSDSDGPWKHNGVLLTSSQAWDGPRVVRIPRAPTNKDLVKMIRFVFWCTRVKSRVTSAEATGHTYNCCAVIFRRQERAWTWTMKVSTVC